MRYPAAEQLEIIRLVEQSRLPVRRTLDKLGILPARLYRWYNRYQSGGYEALKDRPPRPKQAWNRIPDDVRGRVLRLALDAPALSPRELATRCIDTAGSCVSEASGYRRLKAHDLITSPAFGVIKAANAFKDKTVRPNQLWQTDFTYLKVSGWGWVYLSTILDDFSRSIIAWTLCTTMRTEDVTDTLELALKGLRLRSGEGRPYATAVVRQRIQLSLRATWPNGSMIRAWSMSVAHLTLPRPRARSSAGTRPSRTGSCWRTIICPVISKPSSASSSSTTTTGATTRA